MWRSTRDSSAIWTVGWLVELGFYVPLDTKHGSFQRRLLKPIYWLGVETKPNSTKARIHQSKQMHYNTHTRTHTQTHTRLTALCPGLPRWAGTRKLKPIWIFLKQQTVSGSGISWAICKSAPYSREITMPAPHHSKCFTGRMPFLPPNQQRQSTEGNYNTK